MTQPQESIEEIRQATTLLKDSLSKLERIVAGDTSLGSPSLRDAINAVKTEMNNEVDALCDRVGKLEEQSRLQTAFQNGMLSVVRWLGGTSLVALVGLIGALIKMFGGK